MSVVASLGAAAALLAAAHQGEEFVIILPAIMLVGAFFLMRWANQGKDDENETAQDTDTIDEDAVVASSVGDGSGLKFG